ncbi:signal peptidase I [Vagococcus coleopterorum]|uniref:signal peptidase I n=1 Tax=Vagococcus coleopterorum TaxID=2714946 RepID=UPI001EEAEDB7|nr:signal peptidase I [Vagococcus coleopterorum]
MKDKIVSPLFYYGKMVVLAALIVFIIRGFIFIPMTVKGNSMENSLHPDDQIVYEKISKINRFDTVIFKGDDQQIYIKRVIGMPGERLAFRDNQLYINNELMVETFWPNQELSDDSKRHTANFDTAETLDGGKVPKDAYFVMGDNRLLSQDSRSIGTINEKNIIGKARFVYYPLKHVGTIK